MKINNRLYYLLFGALAFFLSAYGLEYFCNTERLIQRYADIIESDLQVKEREISEILENQTLIESIYANASLDLELLKAISEESFNICLYQKDSLVFWSNNQTALPNNSLINELKNSKLPALKKLSNGYFLLEKIDLPYLKTPEKFALSIIPIKWVYTKSLPHLDTYFEGDKGTKISNDLVVVESKTNFPIQSADGHQLFYLDHQEKITDKNLLRWLLLLYGIGFGLLGLVINTNARNIASKEKPWVGPAFLLFVVFGFRFISLDWSTKFEAFEVFSRSFDNPHISIGDLLINSILLLWVVIFVHKESKDREFTASLSANTRLFLSTMNYLSVVLALLLLISVLKSLILNSGIDFNFKNVFSLDQYSVFAVFGVILLLFTLFIFSYRMMITIHKLNLSRPRRLMALALAILIALPIIYYIELKIPLHFTALLAFVFVIFYDLFIDIPNPGLIWMSLWVVLFAGFSSSLLYNYNEDKEFGREVYIAQKLSEDKDSLAEIGIINFNTALDQSIASLEFPDTSNGNIPFEDIWFNQNYLYTNYTYKIHPYDILETELSEWKEAIASSKSLIPGTKQIVLAYKADKKPFYILNKTLPNSKELIVEFSRINRKRSKVYTNLLSRQKFKGLEFLNGYDFVVIKDGSPTIEQGMAPEDPPFNPEDKPAIGGHVKKSNGATIYFMFRSAENDFVILGKPQNNFFHPFSLFSFIFGFLVLVVGLIALLNSKFSIFPNNLNFQFWNKPSLKNRIQFSTILLTLASFLIIGIVSVYFLTDSYRSYDKGRLERKVSGVQSSAEQHLHQGMDELQILSSYVEDIAQAERIDFNLFDLDGGLIQSSETDVFKKGLLPPKMNTYALQYLKGFITSEAPIVQVQEAIGHDQQFISAFTPIHDTKGNRIAFIGVPYSNQQRTLQNDVLNFMGNLVNVYVFMLIAAGGMSVWVAETITKPITTIGENLKELKLGKSNEPLEWRTNDEIGALVTEYNRMIVKLEHSAKLLARSEREGAWREMAKQVAHEIKNPLTPMKLSIQYLTHAFKSNPDNIEPLLNRVSTTLIEQIDSLAQIASEFSNFAKMPRANNQQIILNDLVESVYDLFKESENSDIKLSLPEEDFYVFADRNHLVRVFNNMIKNAVEAIPDSRRGKIHVSLSKVENRVMVKVQDNGVGIPEDKREKVFVPNFTTKNSGTGLGLAISKNIIESVSGSIYFETEKDVGTTFFVELPIEDMVLEEA